MIFLKNKNVIYAAAIIAVAVLTCSLVYYIYRGAGNSQAFSTQNPEEELLTFNEIKNGTSSLEQPLENLEEIEEEAKSVKAYITGEVETPGVYELNLDGRISDLLRLAGGSKDSADLSKINLARVVEDGEHIVIPAVGEEYVENSIKEQNKPKNTPSPSNEQSPEDEENGSEASVSVNINTATLEELILLPKIGPSTAQAIIDYREENGKFTEKEQLKNVRNIGEKTFELIKDKVILE